jgi:WD40 repeat protein
MTDLVASHRIHHGAAVRCITALKFKNDYQLITGGNDNTLYVCDSSLQRTAAWAAVPETVTNLFVTVDKCLVGLTTSGRPFLWERYFKADHEDYELDIAHHSQLCLLSDTLFAAIHPSAGVSVVDMESPEEIAFMIPEDALRISPQGNSKLLVLNRAAQLVSWDAASMQSTKGAEGCHSLLDVKLLVAHNDTHAAVVNRDDPTYIRILALPFHDEPYLSVPCGASITKLVSWGSYVIAGTVTGSVIVYNVSTDTIITSTFHSYCITALQVLPDGRIASGDRKGYLKIMVLSDT